LTEPGVRIATFATQGTESHDADRARRLVSELPAELWEFDRRRRLRSALHVIRKASSGRYDLVVMEGTGVAGGLALITARLLHRVRYVVSTGDAVAPYVGSVLSVLRPLAALYERLLYRLAAGVIGWSPYVTGRALTLGARRAMTAPHWSRIEGTGGGEGVRKELGIPDDSIVVGVVGSLAWNRRRQYCYGLELVAAIKQLDRPDVVALIVGDGSGMSRLAERAGTGLNKRIFLPGAVQPADLHRYLGAIDIAVLAQSIDGVGSFRYTSKLSDYLRAAIPVISTEIPVAYDVGVDWMWRLPGEAPWDPKHIEALASLLERLDRSEIEEHRSLVPTMAFDGESQQRAVTGFLRDLLAGSSA
jgi:hypothetical protein